MLCQPGMSTIMVLPLQNQCNDMQEEKTYRYYATSYAIKASELYCTFPTHKYIHLPTRDLPAKYDRHWENLYGSILRYFFYLMICDVIENKVIFKLPPITKACIKIDPVTGDDFIRARQNGAFQDVDYLASNFTGYEINLNYNTRYGSWKKRIYVSSKFRDRIVELTNKGESW